MTVVSRTESDSPDSPAGIDPVETLAALRHVADVRDAILADRPGPDGVPTTVAYLTGPDPALGTGPIRQQLLSQLPRDMVPKYFVILPALPLTPDGDYDLAALPEPDAASAPVPAREFVEPRTPVEIRLAGIIKKILGIDKVGVYDSIFALGGSSLQAAFVATDIKDLFGVELTLQDMFANATVDELGRIVVQALGERAGSDLIKERRRSPKGMWLAVHGKLPLWLRRLLPPGVPCGGTPGDGKRRFWVRRTKKGAYKKTEYDTTEPTAPESGTVESTTD
jgi:acyl carrier protein